MNKGCRYFDIVIRTQVFNTMNYRRNETLYNLHAPVLSSEFLRLASDPLSARCHDLARVLDNETRTRFRAHTDIPDIFTHAHSYVYLTDREYT